MEKGVSSRAMRPLRLFNPAKLSLDELWFFWIQGFDVSAELERRYGL